MDAVSVSATAVGLAIGSLVLCANFQFGLQTGWVSMMSMPAALLGFAWFKLFRQSLSPQDNVYIQSVAVAVGTGPLSFGFVGALPAIQKLLTPDEGQESLGLFKLIFWSLSIGFMGIFTAMLIRDVIIRNRELTFPSGAAAAALIGVIHGTPVDTPTAQVADVEGDEESGKMYARNIRLLITTFIVSSVCTVTSRLVPLLRNLPVLGYNAAQLMWTFDPSPAYIGQGIIMGLPTTFSMLGGAVMGWAILAPLAHSKGWAPGPIDDWQDGAQGWIMWVSLAIMVADTGVNFVVLSVTFIREAFNACWNREGPWIATIDSEAPGIEDPVSQRRLAISGLLASAVLNVAIIKFLFSDMSILALVLAVAVSPALSLLGIRALGETDLNPVSSIAKLTQFLFGILMRNHPHAVLLNIAAGAITEAGAQQAGDLMQDYKTGSLLGAPMTSQTIGMVVGTCWSVILSALVYSLYTRVYEIPGPEFRIPTAFIWADVARLMTGQGLPPKAGSFALCFGLIFVCIAIAKKHRPDLKWIPSGVAVGIGMYNVPSFTLARFCGGVISWLYSQRRSGASEQITLVILSSGLILGEGLMSVLALVVSVLSI